MGMPCDDDINQLLRKILVTKYKTRADTANAVGLLLPRPLAQPSFSKSNLWREMFYCLGDKK